MKTAGHLSSCFSLPLLLAALVLCESVSTQVDELEISSDSNDINILYVKPDSSSHCPDWIPANSTCETLSYYLKHVHKFFVSNTCMEFLNGNHFLDLNYSLRLEDKSNFSLIGTVEGAVPRHSDGSPLPASQIVCTNTSRTGFYFVNSSNIVVENLGITQCGLKLSKHINVSAALAFDTVLNVELVNVRIDNCTGFGVHADRMLGRSTVSNSAFVSNYGTKDYYGGNFRLWYRDCPSNLNTFLLIEDSWFKHGYDIYKSGPFYPHATGLTLLVDCSFVRTIISNITALGNFADDGGNLAIRLNFTSYNPDVGSVLLKDSRILDGQGHRGGGMRVWSRIYGADKVYCMNLSTLYVTLRVVNTEFVGNRAVSAGGAVYISHYESEHVDCVLRTVTFESCLFKHNSVPAAGNGAVAEIIKHSVPTITAHMSPQFQVNFTNCRFVENWIILDERGLVHGAIMDILSFDSVSFNSCHFTDNNSTAVSSVDSSIVLSGHSEFRRNSAVNGGALRFCDSSYMYIEQNASALFEGNRANNSGGAIFAPQRCLETAPSCFFQPLVEDFTQISAFGRQVNMSLKFVNNSAGDAGSAIYGGSIDYCFTFKRLIHGDWKSYYLSGEVFDKIFNVSEEKPNHGISSNAYGVCFCNESSMRPLCDAKHKKITFEPKYSGEVFEILAATVGQRSGFSSAIVGSVIIGDKQSRVQQHTTRPVNECTWLKFSVHSTALRVTFNLTVQQAHSESNFYFRYHYPQVVVNLKPCPWGFEPPGDSSSVKTCQCKQILKQFRGHCDLATGNFSRSESVWVGYNWLEFESQSDFVERCRNVTSNDSSFDACQQVIVNAFCPYDYCRHNKVYINADTVDLQCNYGRSGVLCGACGSGLSSILSGSRCKKCNSDNVVPLVLFFFISGFILVIFLILVNLTITEGLMNGLIFYMNIVRANMSLYFPAGKLHYTVEILTAAVEWFNLDVGFEICFFRGLDEYLKTWLQFFYPVYLWLIVAGIIFLSRKFLFVQRLVGKNAVKVLATLFLLSMAKLSQAIIFVFSFVSLNMPDGKIAVVWRPDGNVRYLYGKHIPLFLVGTLFLILVLCYTFLLMFYMCLQKLPCRRAFSFISRLKPFFDAHSGPYKSRCRFWTGLLLLTRCLLFIMYTLRYHSNPRVGLVLTALVSLALLSLMVSFNGVYRRLHLNILEMLAFLNLGILAVTWCYLGNEHRHEKKGIVVSSVSVSVACVTFVVVLIFQCYRQIRNSKILRKFFFAVLSTPSVDDVESPLLQEDTDGRSTSHTYTEVVLPPTEEESAREILNNMNSVVAGGEIPNVASFSQCREPLIESCTADS